MLEARVEGKVKLVVTNTNEVQLISERDNDTILELTIDDDEYKRDYVGLVKNLMGQCFQALYECTNQDEMAQAVEEELQNWDNYYIELKEGM